MTALHASWGRWGGQLTSRPLPEIDPEIAELSAEQRAELAAVWLGRAASERRVADAFVVVHAALRQLQAREELTRLAERAVDDEYRHAELSRIVAERFAGKKLQAPPELALVVPEHVGAEPQLLHSLHIIGQCALNETFASAFLEATLELTQAELAQRAVRELLSDEIDHARIGWGHLAELSPERRVQVAPWLLPMVRANLRMWRVTARPYPVDPVLHRHGAPPAAHVEQALLGAIADLIIPGLAQLGFPTRDIELWLGQGAPT